MRRQILCSVGSVVVMAFFCGLPACTSNSGAKNGTGGAGTSPTSTGGKGGAGGAGGAGGTGGAGTSQADASCEASDPDPSYVLIDDMETTTHGPIEFSAGIAAPLAQGYWYNAGANYFSDAGADTSDPPQLSFAFSALPAPTTTLNCKASAHAARQHCTLNGLYDICGVGFEFAQVPDGDAGVLGNPSASDAGDAGASIPMVTVPFDISRYKAITFWGMTTTPDPKATTANTMQVKVSFPDTDTDPRGNICNGGGGNTSKCYNSYARYLDFTTSWQQFTVLLDPGTGGKPPTGGIAIDTTWGYLDAQWIPTQVYGINWQAQRNSSSDVGPALVTEIWVDDVYFVQ